MAYRLMLFPMQSLTVVASRALYPILSRQQTQVGEMATLYLRAVSLIATITAPLMAGLFVLRDTFVAVAFGSAWGPVADVLAWLAPCGFLQSIAGSTGAIFMARGRTDLMLRLGILTACTQLSAFAVGAQYDIVALAALYLVANALNIIPVMLLTMRQLEMPLSTAARALAVPVFSSLVMAVAMHGMEVECTRLGAADVLALFLASGLGLVIYMAVLRFAFRYKFEDFILLIRRR
jgi:PST family polysaccharide transporter